jgi:hypothetical protein
MRMWSGVAIGLVLVVTWVVAFIVTKVTSAAIHLLVVAAVIMLVLNVISRVRNRVGPPGAGTKRSRPRCTS